MLNHHSTAMGDARLHARVLLYGNKEAYLRMLKAHCQDLCSMKLQEGRPDPSTRAARPPRAPYRTVPAAAPMTLGAAFFYPDDIPDDENGEMPS